MATLRVTTLVLLAAVSLVSDADARRRRPVVNPYGNYQSALYGDSANWLCRPDKGDVCDHDLDATRIDADGTAKVEAFRPARKPKIDCFYVYPTISTDVTGNSDLVPGDDQELYVVRQQAARLGSVCRVFAPVYRQITLTALIGILAGTPIPIDPPLAYGDVVDAWKHYIANDNKGRGVLLIGHSQGSGQLVSLLKNEIDGNPDLRGRLVSAMLLGTSFQVPVGADVGGDLANIPLCRARRQTGCVIAYGSYRSTDPPPVNSQFGRSAQPGWEAACVNPAALKGGKGALHPYLPTNAQALPITPPTPVRWVDPSKNVDIATKFVTLPDWVEAECAVSNGYHYLSVNLLGAASDSRVDDLSGADIIPSWGLHLVDVNIAMGDLVAVAKTQTQGYCARNRCRAAR